MAPEEQELEALWIAAFGQPPAIRSTAECLIDYLVRYLPNAPCYAPGPMTAAPAAADSDPVAVTAKRS